MNKRIPVSDGYITMNDKFKYLGSWVKDDLREDHEVSVQIAKATAQMVMLRKYFNCPYVEVGMKYCTYLVIPLNNVLWGYESWAVSEGIKRQLSVFHHRSVRQILEIQRVHTCQPLLRSATQLLEATKLGCRSLRELIGTTRLNNGGVRKYARQMEYRLSLPLPL
jgi:hypothetical protein